MKALLLKAQFHVKVRLRSGPVSYTHLIAIQEGMSEIQTIKTAIHEIANAKLHAVTPGEKVAPEDKKDRRTEEV